MDRRTFITLAVGACASGLSANAQKRERLVGYLSSVSGTTYPRVYLDAFLEGLNESGYVEGKNVTVNYRWAEDHYDKLPTLAEELVQHKVDVIATSGGIVSALAAKSATATIPIVFAMGDDPVAAGLVESFAHPGGNLTGVSFFVVELGAKLFELGAELVGGSAPVAVLANPHRPSYGEVRRTIEEAARAKGRPLLMLDITGDDDFEPAFAALKQAQAGALVVTSDPLLLDRRKRLVALAAEHAIPTVYAWRAFTAEGGLISYGVDLASEYHQLGKYVGRVLSGEKPADLPIQRPAKFALVVNLKTAKPLGVTVPQSLLARPDEVIE
jgi:ABC-type uncharacterized transport system substrate-binding protein